MLHWEIQKIIEEPKNIQRLLLSRRKEGLCVMHTLLNDHSIFYDVSSLIYSSIILFFNFLINFSRRSVFITNLTPNLVPSKKKKRDFFYASVEPLKPNLIMPTWKHFNRITWLPLNTYEKLMIYIRKKNGIFTFIFE